MSTDFYKFIDMDWALSACFYIDDKGRARRCNISDAEAWAKETGKIVPEIQLSWEDIPEGAQQCLVEPVLDDGEEDAPDQCHRFATAKLTSISDDTATAQVYICADKELADLDYWQKRLTRIIAAFEVQRLANSVSDKEAVLLFSQAGTESIATIDLNTYEVNAIGQINTTQQMSLFPEITQVPLLFYCNLDIYDEGFNVPQIYINGKRVSENISIEDELAIPKNMTFKNINSFLVGSAFGLWDTLGQPYGKRPKSLNNEVFFEQINENAYPISLREFDIDKYRNAAMKMFLTAMDSSIEDCVRRQETHTSTFGIVIRKPKNEPEQYSLLILEDSGLFKGAIEKDFATKLMEALPVYAYIIEDMSGKSSVNVVVRDLLPCVAVDIATVDNHEEVYKFYDRAMVTASVLGNCSTFDSGILDAAKDFSRTVAESKYQPEESVASIYDIREVDRDISL